LRGNGKHKPTWRLQITHSRDINKFIEIVGLPTGKDEVFLDIYSITSKIPTKESNGHFRDRISSIEYAGEQEVFATMVETGHNYLGNGFIHGNSERTIRQQLVVHILCIN